MPNGVLKNGASLVVPGLITGEAKALFDGANDYIDPQWPTRTNWNTNPGIEVNTAGYDTVGSFFINGGAAVTRDVATKVEGAASLKVACANVIINEGVRMPSIVPVKIGDKVTLSAWMRGAVGGEKVQLCVGDAVVGFVTKEVTLTAAFVRYEVTLTATAEGTTSIAFRNPLKSASVFYADSMLVEKAATAGTYFPNNTQLANAEAGWSGAAHASASDIGPFARGVAKTFVMFANVSDLSNNKALFGGLTGDSGGLYVGSGTGRFAFYEGAGVVNAFAEATKIVLGSTTGIAYIHDGPNLKSKLSRNGGALEEIAMTADWDPFQDSLIIASGAGLGLWQGTMLPFAVFNRALSSQEILDLYEYTTSNTSVKRQMVPDRLAIRIDAPNGASARWAEDELTPYNVLSDVEMSDEMPGGYKEFSGTLARDPQINYQDLGPYGDVKAYTPGGEIVWRGSLDKGPGSSGDHFSINPSALGYQYVLEDNNACHVGFIDRDLGRWGEPSLQRKQDLLAAGVKFDSAEVSQGMQMSGALGPGINISVYHFDASGIEWGETLYYSGGCDVAEIHGDFFGHGEDANWEDICGMGRSAELADFINARTEDMNAKVSVPHFIAKVPAGATGYQFGVITTSFPGSPGFIGDANISHRWVNITVIGQHGLKALGVWPNIGFSAKQCLEYLIKTYASPLTVDSDFVDDDGYVIPQAWYGDGASLSDIVNDLTKYGLYDWFVYNEKRFELRKPQTYNRFWRALTAPSELEEVGVDSQRLWRSVMVQYTDATGATRTVGPPGSSANTISSELEITDPDHPAVKANRTRRDTLSLGGVSTPAAATAVGKRFLEEANLTNRSGSAVLRGYVMDSLGVLRPASQVKSGDWIAFTDAADTSYRKIINKRYRHNDRSAEVDLDAPASGMEELLERLQADLIPTGVT